MDDDNIKVRNASSGGTINQAGNQIGGTGNRMHGNVIHIAERLGVRQGLDPTELLAALRQLRVELDKASDLSHDDADDLKTDLDAAIKAVDREQPNQKRALEKLTTMQKMLDGLKDSAGSALALGKLIGEVILAARGLHF